MHEMAVVSDIVDAICSRAEEIGASRVVSVRLRVGVMRDFHEVYLQRYFDFFSRETIAEGVKVSMDPVPIRYRCDCCGLEYGYDPYEGKILFPDLPVEDGPCSTDGLLGRSGKDFSGADKLVWAGEQDCPRCIVHPDAEISIVSGTELSIEEIGVI